MNLKPDFDSFRTAIMGAVVAALLLLAGNAGAGTPGTFSPTGYMKMARAHATGTQLLDGKVLITGGTYYPGTSGDPYVYVTNTAELYDPASGTFTYTGDMTMPRTNHCAALLQDGRVLITGGVSTTSSGWMIRGTAEIYDPSNGSFSRTANMVWDRENHTCVTLPSGEVLIAGGEAEATSSGTFFALNTAELYNPSTGTFASTGNLLQYANSPFASLLNSGNVLVGGFGSADCSGNCDQPELYSPSSGSFSNTGAMRSDHTGGTITPLFQGSMLVAGGGSQASANATDIYSVGAGTFSAGPNLTAQRAFQTATLLANGEVLVAGGASTAGTGQYVAQSSADLYTPSNNTVSATGSMTVGRQDAVAVGLYNGLTLVAGGIDQNGNYRGQCDLYTPPSQPAVRIMWPIHSQVVANDVNFFTAVSPQVLWIDSYVDGKFFKAVAAPDEVTWNSALVQNGSHTFSVAAFNRSDQELGTDSITVEVENR